MPDAKDAIKEVFHLGAEVVKKSRPQVEGDLPTLDELQQKLDEIYPPAEPPAEPGETPPKPEPKPHKHAKPQEIPDVATACVACSVGHWSTCSGLLNEAMRFGKKDGMSNEVIDRVNKCLDELNSLERIDLTPEKILNAPAWEKDLAETVLVQSRETRHKLETITNINEVEQLAADTEKFRRELGREWYKRRLSHLNPSDKKKIREKAHELVEEELK